MHKILFLAIVLILAAITSNAQMQFFPESVDFGQVTTGNTDTVEVVFSSEITQNVTLSATATPFAVEPQEFFIHKDSVKILLVMFQPQDLGVYQQTITATGDVFGEATLPLTGEGIEANITVTPLAWDFGGVTLNTTDTARFYVSNTGTGNLLCTFETGNPFYTTATDSLVVPYSGLDSLEVYFTPEFLDAENAVLAITSNDPDNSLVQIPLSGYGVNEISGEVSGTWHKDNSPYTFVGNVNVPWDDTLTIMPGVEINMGEHNFEVFGRLVCNGEENDSIRFSGNGLLRFSSQYPNDSIQFVLIDLDTTSGYGLKMSTHGIKISNCKILGGEISNRTNRNTFYDDFEDMTWEDKWQKGNYGNVYLSESYGFEGYGIRINGNQCELTSNPIVINETGYVNIGFNYYTSVSSSNQDVRCFWKKNSGSWNSNNIDLSNDWEEYYINTEEIFNEGDTLRIRFRLYGYYISFYVDNIVVGAGPSVLNIENSILDIESLTQFTSTPSREYSTIIINSQIQMIDNLETIPDYSSILIDQSIIDKAGHNAIQTNGDNSAIRLIYSELSNVAGRGISTNGQHTGVSLNNTKLFNISSNAIRTFGENSGIECELSEIHNIGSTAIYTQSGNASILIKNTIISSINGTGVFTNSSYSKIFIFNSILKDCSSYGLNANSTSYEITYSTILNNGYQGAYINDDFYINASSIFNSIICLNNGSFGNQIQNGIYQEYSKTAGDPKFADSLGHLLPNSPCVDGADPTDRDSLMPQGLGTVRADMGVYGGPGNWIWGGTPVPGGEPEIQHIADIPQDEGGQVLLQFKGSIFDYEHSGYNIDHYSFWRTSNLEKGDPANAPKKPLGDSFAHNREYWEKLGEMSAQGFEEYGYTAQTYGDSLPGQIIWTKFMVIAHAEEYEQFWISQPDSAYSIDNLAPAIPQNLTGNLAFSNYQLSWLPAPQNDLNHYALYRSTDGISFPVQPTATTVQPFLAGVPLEPDAYFYAVTSIDHTGNESAKSNVVISPVSDQITIPEGWSGLSSWIVPEATEIPYVIAPVSTSLILLQNDGGIYWPGQNLNTLGNWNTHDGYIIKMAENSQLPFTGYKETDRNWQLTSGWQLLPVISSCPMETSEIQNQLTDNLVMIKEVAGWRIYWPAMGIQTLQVLEPGKAYFLNTLTGNGSFTFPECSGMKSTLKNPEQITGVQHWASSPPNPTAHIIAFAKEAALFLQPGDCVGVINSMGECAGTTWIGENENGLYINAYGNDPTTWQNEGMQAGEIMQFRLYRPVTETEFELLPAYKQTAPNSDGCFTANGVSIIENFKLNPLDISEHATGDISIYPNPTQGHFRITGVPSGTDYEILNNQGMLIRQGKIPGNRLLYFQEQTPGVYFLKLKINGNVKMLKIIKK